MPAESNSKWRTHNPEDHHRYSEEEGPARMRGLPTLVVEVLIEPVFVRVKLETVEEQHCGSDQGWVHEEHRHGDCKNQLARDSSER